MNQTVTRAVEHCSEELSCLHEIQDKLSSNPGTAPDYRYEWWLGRLQGALGYLLTVIEDEA